jgi:phytoene dehydrogenase-like protein
VFSLDLERRFGITEGNIFHGIFVGSVIFMRPSGGPGTSAAVGICVGWNKSGGGVTGAPGYNAARMILKTS